MQFSCSIPCSVSFLLSPSLSLSTSLQKRKKQKQQTKRSHNETWNPSKRHLVRNQIINCLKKTHFPVHFYIRLWVPERNSPVGTSHSRMHLVPMILGHNSFQSDNLTSIHSPFLKPNFEKTWHSTDFHYIQSKAPIVSAISTPHMGHMDDKGVIKWTSHGQNNCCLHEIIELLQIHDKKIKK